MSALCEREVSCESLGQRKASAHKTVYHKNPSERKNQFGKTRSYVAVCFRWSFVGAMDLEGVIIEQRNEDARRHGVTRPENFSGFAAVAPCMLWCDRALEGLQKAANDFVRRYGLELLHEFWLKVQCSYVT